MSTSNFALPQWVEFGINTEVSNLCVTAASLAAAWLTLMANLARPLFTVMQQTGHTVNILPPGDKCNEG